MSTFSRLQKLFEMQLCEKRKRWLSMDPAVVDIATTGGTHSTVILQEYTFYETDVDGKNQDIIKVVAPASCKPVVDAMRKEGKSPWAVLGYLKKKATSIEDQYDRIYRRVYGESEIFKASTPEEGVKRKQEYVKIMIKELIDSGRAKLNGNGSYDVEGDVDLSSMGLTRLPVKFNKVGRDFSCSSNNLTNLEGAPRKVGRDFSCFSNKLTNLEGAPREVGGNFYCFSNNLTTLEGAPREVSGNFYCDSNKLTTLEGAPREVGGYFDCSYNHLTTLEGAPREVSGNFACNSNNLTTLEGAPKKVDKDFYCHHNTTEFTRDEVRSVCDVKGSIYV